MNKIIVGDFMQIICFFFQMIKFKNEEKVKQIQIL